MEEARVNAADTVNVQEPNLYFMQQSFMLPYLH